MRGALVAAAVAAVFMTVTGALGTGEEPFWKRLAYWSVLMGTGAALSAGAAPAVRNWHRLHATPLLEGGLIALLISLPLTVVVSAASFVFFGAQHRTPLEFAYVFGIVFFVSAILTAIGYATNRSPETRTVIEVRNADPVPEPDAANAGQAKFADRLPRHLRESPILALQAEDHYLRVHCRDGSTLILMRLSDAIAELGGMDGAQTHRSWWVARDAVVDARRGEGRAILTLPAALEVPVSRSFVARLNAAGWFG